MYSLACKLQSYTVFTHEGLAIRYRKKSLYKSVFVLSRSYNIQFKKRKESLLKIAAM